MPLDKTRIALRPKTRQRCAKVQDKTNDVPKSKKRQRIDLRPKTRKRMGLKPKTR